MLLENNVIQKLKLQKKMFTNVLLNRKKCERFTLKMRFWHFLIHAQQLNSQITMISFEYVDFGPQFLLFRTQTTCQTKSKYKLGKLKRPRRGPGQGRREQHVAFHGVPMHTAYQGTIRKKIESSFFGLKLLLMS